MSSHFADDLIQRNLLTYDQLKAVVEEQKRTGQKLEELLVTMGYISEFLYAEHLSKQFGVPPIDIESSNIPDDVIKIIRKNLAVENTLIPVELKDSTLLVAMLDPDNLLIIDDLRFATGFNIDVCVASERVLKGAIDKYYGVSAQEAADEAAVDEGLREPAALQEEPLQEPGGLQPQEQPLDEGLTGGFEQFGVTTEAPKVSREAPQEDLSDFFVSSVSPAETAGLWEEAAEAPEEVAEPEELEAEEIAEEVERLETQDYFSAPGAAERQEAAEASEEMAEPAKLEAEKVAESEELEAEEVAEEVERLETQDYFSAPGAAERQEAAEAPEEMAKPAEPEVESVDTQEFPPTSEEVAPPEAAEAPEELQAEEIVEGEEAPEQDFFDLAEQSIEADRQVDEQPSGLEVSVAEAEPVQEAQVIDSPAPEQEPPAETQAAGPTEAPGVPEEAADAQTIKRKVVIRKGGEAEAGPKSKVLVVDDSPSVQKIVSITLEKRGYEVIVADNGMQALAKLSELVPDMIFLDIDLPYMDGYQLCKVIKGNELTKNVPVVMLSGKDGFFDKVRGKMAGASDYITKPFQPSLLVEAVVKHTKHDG